DASQCCLHFFQPILRPFADKFRGDVQIGNGRPVDVSRGAEQVHQGLKMAAHVFGNVDGGEQSHKRKLIVYCVILLPVMKVGMKLGGVALACAAGLFAADFWTAKPFTDWNEKDAQKMVENSPWAKPVSVATGTDGPPASRSGKRGATAVSEVGDPGRQDDPMGDVTGRPGRNRVGEEAGPIAATTVTVRWQSALPVRQALMKIKYGNEAGTSP